jgi:hypothetical protein
VTQILSDLDRVEDGLALKVPLAQFTESKEKVRSCSGGVIIMGDNTSRTLVDRGGLPFASCSVTAPFHFKTAFVLNPSSGR